MMRPVLVTGATGFIGRNVVQALVRAGRRVVALTRSSSSLPDGATRLVATDWTESGLRQCLADTDFGAVVHLAAYGVAPSARDANEMRRVNIDLPMALVAITAEHKAVAVMAGSCAEYAAPTTEVPIEVTAPLEAIKLYGKSKSEGGSGAISVATALGVPLRYLRLFNVYGPGEPAHRLLPSLIAAASSGTRADLSAGLQVRDWIHVDDVVQAMKTSLDALLSGRCTGVRTLNVCTSIGTSVRDFATMAAGQLSMDPASLSFGSLPLRPDDVPWLVGSNGETRIDLGWQPTYDLRRGLAATISSLRASAPNAAVRRGPDT
jgi:nucleoside-diphosphate-sugar epimerase